MSSSVEVSQLPVCDFDAKHGDAHYDGKTQEGPWAYMCNNCFVLHGVGLGTGLGQRLILRIVLPKQAPMSLGAVLEFKKKNVRP